MRHIIFHGVYGISNIRIVNKHRLQLQELHDMYGDHISTDSHKKYREFTDILREIDYNRYENGGEGMIIHHEQPKLDRHYSYDFLRKKDVEWFVDHICCWRDEQYRLDSYYQFMVDSPMGPHYLVLAVLRKVIYTNDMTVRLVDFGSNMNMVQQDMPKEIGIIPYPNYKTISEQDHEFKDAFIVVRRQKKKDD